MDIRTFALGPLQTNGYLLSKDGKAVFIDPGGDVSEVIGIIRAENLELTHILITHFHIDHILGVAQLKDATNAIAVANPGDAYLLDTDIGMGPFMGLPAVPPFEFEPLPPGDCEFLGLACRALSTPGHTGGSLSFYFPEPGVLFAGDLLFKRSIGRVDFPGGSMDTLLDSVREQVFTLPGETVVYSGHGPETSVADESNHNPFFR